MDLINSFISLILRERAFDLSVDETARRLLRDIIDGIKGYPNDRIKKREIEVNGQFNSKCYFLNVDDLGILSDNITSKLAVGIIDASTYQSDAGAVYLTKNKYMPSGGVFIIDDAAVPKAERILFALQQNKHAFYHELVHFVEFALKASRDRMQSVERSIDQIDQKKTDKEKLNFYLMQPHELNAHLHQFFHVITDKFESNYKRHNKKNAAKFVSNAQELWKRFYKLMPSFKSSVGEDLLMKKLSFRLWELWQDYVEKLPD